jgi:signal transduction histidine kinase
VTEKFFTTTGLLACAFERETLRITQCSDSLALSADFENPGTVIGHYLFDLFSPTSLETLERVLQNRDPSSFQCNLKGQQTLSVNATILTETGTSNGGAILICIPCVDNESELAEQAATIAQLEARSNRLESFTDLINHDLRNALHLVTANIELLGLETAQIDNQQVSKRVAKLKKGAVSMTALLDGVSKYLRCEVGDYPMELTDLNSLVDNIIDSAKDHPSKTVQINRSSTLPDLICDQRLVQELFQNLIGNSIKYADDATVKIEIGVASSNSEQPVFFIKDNGVGIAPEDIDRIFLPFTRADRQGLNRYGTGMGMALVKKIVERHGGEIWLESTVNRGTTVNFSIGTHGVA